MEARLREYRAARRRNQVVDSVKLKVVEAKSKLAENLQRVKSAAGEKLFRWARTATSVVYPYLDKLLDYFPTVTWNMEPEDETKVLINSNSHETANSDDLNEEIKEPATQESWMYFTVKWSLYFIVWLTTFIFFVKIEFGAVFVIISMLVGVCLNTRTNPKKKGEISAYSVFNKNCESIDGTLTAQQFEREIMFGPGAVR